MVSEGNYFQSSSEEEYYDSDNRKLITPERIGTAVGLGLCALLLTAPIRDLREWNANRMQEQPRVTIQQQGELA